MLGHLFYLGNERGQPDASRSFFPGHNEICRHSVCTGTHAGSEYPIGCYPIGRQFGKRSAVDDLQAADAEDEGNKLLEGVQ